MSGAVQIVGGAELLASLDAASVKAPEELHKVTQRGAFNIKGRWRELWSGHQHIPALPQAVTYDTELRGLASMAEIGVDKNRRQGPLGNIIAFGSPHSAPIPGPLTALDEEAPRYEKAILDVGASFLEKAP